MLTRLWKWFILRFMEKKMAKPKKQEELIVNSTGYDNLVNPDPPPALDQVAYTIAVDPTGHWNLVRVKFNVSEVERLEFENCDLRDLAIERLKVTLGKELF
jgi:hypothetical protein